MVKCKTISVDLRVIELHTLMYVLFIDRRDVKRHSRIWRILGALYLAQNGICFLALVSRWLNGLMMAMLGMSSSPCRLSLC